MKTMLMRAWETPAERLPLRVHRLPLVAFLISGDSDMVTGKTISIEAGVRAA